MRIDLGITLPAIHDSVEAKVRTSADSMNEAAEYDPASVAEQSRGVQSLHAAIEQMPEIRQDKVQALSQLIHSGTYSVSSEQTAEAVMSEMTQVPAA